MPPTRTMRCPSSVRTRQRALMAIAASEATSANSSRCGGAAMRLTMLDARKKRTGLGPHPAGCAARRFRREAQGLCQEVWNQRRQLIRTLVARVEISEEGATV